MVERIIEEGRLIRYLDTKSGEIRKGVVTGFNRNEGIVYIKGCRGRTVYRWIDETFPAELDYD